MTTNHDPLAATFRLDLDPLDLLRALAGVANIGLGPDGERVVVIGRNPGVYVIADNWSCA